MLGTAEHRDQMEGEVLPRRDATSGDQAVPLARQVQDGGGLEPDPRVRRGEQVPIRPIARAATVPSTQNIPASANVASHVHTVASSAVRWHPPPARSRLTTAYRPRGGGVDRRVHVADDDRIHVVDVGNGGVRLHLGMPPKQRKGSAVAATMETSSSASPGSAAVMSGHIGPTD